jgi:phage terminase small subunit
MAERIDDIKAKMDKAGIGKAKSSTSRSRAAKPKAEEAEGKQLTLKQQRFVYEYQIGGNGTAAAIRAGYSPNTSQEIASRLLKNSLIKFMIEVAENKRLKRLEITADRIKKELAKVAFANMADFADWGPRSVKLKDSSKLSREDTAAISEVYQKTGKMTERGIKLHSKVSALELLAKIEPELKEIMKTEVKHSGLVGVQIIDDIGK